MKLHLYLIYGATLLASIAYAEPDYPKAKVSFNDFEQLVSQVETYRTERLIDFETFLKMSKEEGAVILDTRSKFRYDRIHLKGATHLNFSDFTQANLAEIIPSFSTTVLIYCNNNFEGNQTDFASKIALPTRETTSPISLDGEVLRFAPIAPEEDSATTVTRQFAIQEKPLMMALNIPTYINLYGYGYRNVYELHELVDVNDPRATFEGTIINSNTK